MKFKIEQYQQVTSTNLMLKKMAGERKLKEGTVILADFQTAGKGRGNNIWNSEPGANLLFSLFIRPDLKVENHFALNEFVSLSICDTLAQYKVESWIKWPNDIYVNERKLAGLLIENVIAGDTITESVIGVGFNLNQTIFPKEVPNPVSLSALLGYPVSRDDFLNCLLSHLGSRYDQLKHLGFQGLYSDYVTRVYKRDEQVDFITADGKAGEGILENINTDGTLMIRMKDHNLRIFLFDEIRLKC